MTNALQYHTIKHLLATKSTWCVASCLQHNMYFAINTVTNVLYHEHYDLYRLQTIQYTRQHISNLSE